MHDRSTGVTERASVDSSGGQADGGSSYPSLSSDGRRLAFRSFATNLVANDTNGVGDVFLRDRTTGATERVSVDASETEADGESFSAAISGDGRIVAFTSIATNLIAGDTNSFYDVFVRDTLVPAAWSNYGAGVAGTNSVPSLTCSSRPRRRSPSPPSGAPTVDPLLGYRAQLPTHFGGDLLLLPALVVPISFSFGADSFTGALPDDDVLCGFVLDLQVVEADPGAVKGVSFTQGLEIVLGR